MSGPREQNPPGSHGEDDGFSLQKREVCDAEQGSGGHAGER